MNVNKNIAYKASDAKMGESEFWNTTKLMRIGLQKSTTGRH